LKFLTLANSNSSTGNRPARLPTSRIGFHKAFTLIELMISIALIGTLSGIAIPNYISYREKALQARAMDEIRSIELSIMYYYTKTAHYPDSLAEVSGTVALDPWGTPYQYTRIDGGSAPKGKLRKDHFMVPVNTDYDLYSMGKDKASQAPFTAKASHDDIVRCNNGGYVGLASEY
jgi:general secretion pathway protein G